MEYLKSQPIMTITSNVINTEIELLSLFYDI
jgi:hypothetical protein